MVPIELHTGTSRIANIANSNQTARPRAARSGFAQFTCPKLATPVLTECHSMIQI